MACVCRSSFPISLLSRYITVCPWLFCCISTFLCFKTCLHSKISSVIFAVLKVINSQRVELTIYCVKQHSCSVLLYGVISLLHWKCGIKNPPNSLDSAPQWLLPRKATTAFFLHAIETVSCIAFLFIKLHGKKNFVDNFTQDMIGGEHISKLLTASVFVRFTVLSSWGAEM